MIMSVRSRQCSGGALLVAALQHWGRAISFVTDTGTGFLRERGRSGNCGVPHAELPCSWWQQVGD